ncbi:MAG: M20 family metallopeptidase [Actinomycetaceae bacterium]|nr:M20 family metallopeptidase [Actinomycetaceae bacterium]
MTHPIRTYVNAIAAQLIELRRELHQIPEPGLNLPLTAARIRQEIEALGLPFLQCRSATGFTAVLRGERPTNDARPLVLLRADMDALPIVENTSYPWASTNGNMHACGHDLHMAGLVGAMRALTHVRDQLAGDVIFMFQSGEEGHDGAQYMINENMLEAAGRLPDHAYALHVWASRFPSGFIGTKPGPIMASSDTLKITVRGRGGHGSAPHENLDPIPVAAQIILDTQVMIAREFSIFDPVVATCGQIHAGTAPNITPDTASLDYTLRAFNPDTRKRLVTRVSELARSTARSHDMRAEVEHVELYPVTVNADAEYSFVKSAVQQTFPGRWGLQAEPMAAAEDFSKILNQIPGCFISVSAVAPDVDHRQAPFNHSSKAEFADTVVPDCASILALLAWERLTTDG